MSKLVVMDNRLPVTATIYAYSRYKVGDMNTSATPAVAFTAVLVNPLNENITASFMFNFPHGIEPHTQRPYHQLTPKEEEETTHPVGKVLKGVVDPVTCFEACNGDPVCSCWTFNTADQSCVIYPYVLLNGYQEGCYAGVKVRGLMEGGGTCCLCVHVCIHVCAYVYEFVCAYVCICV